MSVDTKESRRLPHAHCFNFLKFRVLECLILNHPRAMTTREIAEQLHEKPHNIAKSISLAHVRGYGYFRRYKRQKGEIGYRYTITKLGVKRYMTYLMRIKRGLTLNTRKTDHIAHYNGRSAKDVDLTTRDGRRLTLDEFGAYIKFRKPEDLAIPDPCL